VDDMISKGVTSAQLLSYRSKIISLLADPDTGYSKLLKDSVDVSSTNDSTLEAAKRGEAAAQLLSYLVQAATTAGFSQDRIMEAFNAMGAIAVPLITTAQGNGSISAATAQSINSSVGGGIQKLGADRSIEKYTQALATLGASGSDLSTFTTAANTLTTTMSAAFAEFDKVFNGSETSADVSAAETTQGNTMTAAFSAFISSTSATNTRILTMISNIDTALNAATGLGVSDFQFFQNGGSATNWPIMMVIPTDWLSSLKTAGGSLSYTVDTLAIPANLSGSLGSRTDYSAIPSPYRQLFELQEDVMIREFKRFDDMDNAGGDMDTMNTTEKAFSDGILTLIGNIGGTTDGSTAISSSQKEALVGLMKSPQF